jgi:thiol-disulfide isomerase/thioredoxin
MKKIVFAIAATAVVLAAAAGGLYAWNRAPVVPPISASDVARTDRPIVIKLHAQWCPKCLMTKGAWSQLQERYEGRVNFVVFDYTNQRTTDASEVEARRVGLGDFFKDAGGTGSVIILDGRTRAVRAWISGVHGVAEYTTAIDAALRQSGA